MGLLIRPTPLPAQAEAPHVRLAVTPASAGWQYVSFMVYHLRAGQRLSGAAQGQETLVMILAGIGEARLNGQMLGEVGERLSVFEDRAPYALYLSVDGHYELVCRSERMEVAIAAAPPTEQQVPARLIGPADISLEIRGSGQTERRIRHILDTDQEAERLIAVEVITPGGNWSSFPPHKHDTENPPHESYLEETYYHHIQPADGFAIQRVYSYDGLDETLTVHDGELVLVPRGYHTVAAVPGCDLYYLNVMAGPRRAWQYQVDAAFRRLLPPSGSITGTVLRPGAPASGR
ncbi:5-deoxy-glucuronate isomerase [Thermogemmatispora sp.]|uniref:5-deoxy-glucuronate isomerase n=1 Tax=Thermogemmatispora sp. TaxID=1968838 RepID=UPI001DDD0DE7|nr:5-deoxy-glucuronate isomerase [Thermogemmatispora sp.]MBX5450845.1 5-deoxy-glucuronate isomerase [Thermogemmatispora sp.]